MLESGTATADAFGIIAIPNVTLLKSRSKLSITVLSTSVGQWPYIAAQITQPHFSCMSHTDFRYMLSQQKKTVDVFTVKGERVSKSGIKAGNGLYLVRFGANDVRRIIVVN